MDVETLLAGLPDDDPGLAVAGRDAAARTVRFAPRRGGGPEVEAAWDATGSVTFTQTIVPALPDEVVALPGWQTQLRELVGHLDAERPGLVACEMRGADPPAVVVTARLLADGVTRHAAIAALDELRKVDVLLAHRIAVLGRVARDSRNAEQLVAQLDGMAGALGALGAPGSAAAPAGQADAAPAVPAEVEGGSGAGIWAATHTVPAGGLTAWVEPDPSGTSIATLAGGLGVEVVERRGDWAHVRCDNGWTGWVGAAGLLPVEATTAPGMHAG